MGVGPADCGAMSLWDFQALRATWNGRHEKPEPDFDRLKVIMAARGEC